MTAVGSFSTARNACRDSGYQGKKQHRPHGAKSLLTRTCHVEAAGRDAVIDKDSNGGTQLGPVGGRILMEVFFGLLDEDKQSYFHDKSWTSGVKPGGGTILLGDVLRFVGLVAEGRRGMAHVS